MTGRVISVNVGQPRSVEWRGQSVRTAIWKLPVQGRVMARRLNLDGDRFRIGEALLEVTQPRVTCYRLGLKHLLKAYKWCLSLFRIKGLISQLVALGNDVLVRSRCIFIIFA